MYTFGFNTVRYIGKMTKRNVLGYNERIRQTLNKSNNIGWRLAKIPVEALQNYKDKNNKPLLDILDEKNLINEMSFHLRINENMPVEERYKNALEAIDAVKTPETQNDTSSSSNKNQDVKNKIIKTLNQYDKTDIDIELYNRIFKPKLNELKGEKPLNEKETQEFETSLEKIKNHLFNPELFKCDKKWKKLYDAKKYAQIIKMLTNDSNWKTLIIDDEENCFKLGGQNWFKHGDSTLTIFYNATDNIRISRLPNRISKKEEADFLTFMDSNSSNQNGIKYTVEDKEKLKTRIKKINSQADLIDHQSKLNPDKVKEIQDIIATCVAEAARRKAEEEGRRNSPCYYDNSNDNSNDNSAFVYGVPH